MKEKKGWIFKIFCIGLSLFFLNFINTEKQREEKKEIFGMQEPTAQEIINKLKSSSPNKQHPRLMANNEDFERIKENLDTDHYLKLWYQELTEDATILLNKPVMAYKKKDGIRLQPISKNILERTITLSLMYKLSEESKYAERAWRELAAVSNKQVFIDWNPSHFLDTASITAAVAIGYDWLYDYLTPNQKHILRAAIINNAFTPAQMVFNNEVNQEKISTFWKDDSNNWNTVCNSGLILAALSIGDESPKLEKISGEVLFNSLNSIKNSMNNYSLGSGGKEGPSYWHYATMYLVYFLSSMDAALGTDYGYSEFKGLTETGYYPIFISGKTAVFNVGDSGEYNFSNIPQLLWFSNKYNKPELATFALDKYSPMNILWYRKGNKNTVDDLPLDKYFKEEQTGIVTMRSSWVDPDGYFVGIHFGDNKAKHSDLDIGTFVLDVLGERWAIDLGPDDYNLPGYFELNTNRWHYYRKRAEGQNTLVINPSNKPDQKLDAKGEIVDFNSTNKTSTLTINMTNAYNNAKKIERTLSFLNNRSSINLEDNIKMNRKSEIYWFMHTRASIRLSSNKKNAILVQNGKILYMKITLPSQAEFSVMEAKSLSTSPLVEKQNENDKIKKLTIHLKNVKETKISVQFSVVPIF
ncbi:heparinase II/III domain-containing protein [Niallia circulans]|uniref:heparinase II/III domain-containing protein n=1 Tax=Niallia circulans TaxID=1397 RepID=UPI003D967507